MTQARDVNILPSLRVPGVNFDPGEAKRVIIFQLLEPNLSYFT